MKLKIGELARIVGLPTATIRYYETMGLMLPPKRSTGNYRIYEYDDLERLRFIMHCRKHDMATADIKKILDYGNDGKGEGKTIIEKNIADIDAQISSLASLRAKLVILAGN